ncbi:MAG: ribonuclease M5 [Oscillospiraceae bacterium]|nr:ribonuclease M5 [Oscillospiraceae bacterium]
MIKEIVVVEGRDDATNVKKAIDAEVISVGGFGINKKVIDLIIEAQNRCGVIVLTDPDYAGDKIRSIISKRVKGIKHAYINREDAVKDGNVGVENAKSEAIIKALKNAKACLVDATNEFTINDLIDDGLSISEKAQEKRSELGKILGIGSCNSKQFINRLNKFGISRDEYSKGLDIIEKNRSK